MTRGALPNHTFSVHLSPGHFFEFWGTQKGGFQKAGFGRCSAGPKTRTRVRSDVPPERTTGTRVGSHVPLERKPERGHIRQNHPFMKPPFYLPSNFRGTSILFPFYEAKDQPEGFLTEVFFEHPWGRGHLRLRTMDVRTEIFSLIFEGLTKLLPLDIRQDIQWQMSANYLAPKLTLWVAFSS